MIDSKYNYHSHTYRCGHAAGLPDSCYIDEALKQGYTKYGITDHVPVHPMFYWDDTVRMHDCDKEEYLDSIDHLKRVYKDSIEIYSGFEAEYDEMIESYLCSLRDSCDYMIMGQHYVLGKDIRRLPIYPIEYAKKVCKGIESGIFDIVAHPDIFMQYRFSHVNKEDFEIFMQNALVASKMICSKALEYGVPLELNLGGTYLFSKKNAHKFDEDLKSDDPKVIAEANARSARYPTRLFWEIASQFGNDVVVGIDAHYPEEIGLRSEKLKKIGTYIDLDSLKILPDTYDPVNARENNVKLQEAYARTKLHLSSVEGRVVANILDEIIPNDDILVCKYKTKTALIRKLREEPPSRKFKTNLEADFHTLDVREDLIKVIKDSVKSKFGESMSKDEYISEIKKDIDYHYDIKKSVIDIDKDGNVIGFSKGLSFRK